MGIAAAPYRRRRRLLFAGFVAALCLVGAAASSAAADTTPPSSPTGVSVTFIGQQLQVKWTASTDNVGVTGYKVMVFTYTWTTTATSYTAADVSKLQCGSAYLLSVVALDAAGNQSIPARLFAYTPACSSAPAPSPTPPPSDGQPPAPSPAPSPSPSPTPTPPAPAPAPPAGSTGSLAVAPNGSNLNSCTTSAPCLTFDRAYHVAAPGQTVFVAAGSYPAQKINPDSTKRSATADVVFMPAQGANVKIARTTIGGSHIQLQNLQTPWNVVSTADSVTLRNVSADGPVYISGASNVAVVGGQVYSSTPVASDSMIASIQGKAPTNILIDGVAFHDFQDIGPGNAHHIECLQIGAGINLTIRNSSFRNCASHDIFMRSWGMLNNSPSPLSNVLIQNNSFGKTTAGFYAMQVMDDLWTGSPKTSVAVLNNTAQQAFVVRVTNGTAQVWHNYLPSMSAYFCNSYGQKAWFDYNTYGAGVPCGAHDVVLGQAPAPTPSPTSSPAPSSTSSSTDTKVATALAPRR
jgi:hypothetical protein